MPAAPSGLATTGLPFGLALLIGLSAPGGGSSLLRRLRTVTGPLDH